MTGAGYLWNGLRVNAVAIMMGLNHWQTRGRLKVLHVRIRRNFAFVQFDTQEEATEALQATHLRVVSVAYALRDNSGRGDVERGDRYCDSPPRRGSYGRHGDSPYWRSPSPGCRGAQILITVVLAALFMTGTTVQCMTGAGVLNVEGMRVLNTADTAVASLSKDEREVI
ncbi:hypothetical protein C1H46_023025 [Malus baccata]|uniref:RRM domain-containing protein n=1 Tax=Malus baccata TaxID=106549 RepID=A0A540LY40_MALBA|nr:hypothetical protein C1H46_023025 [Malus baccata]